MKILHITAIMIVISENAYAAQLCRDQIVSHIAYSGIVLIIIALLFWRSYKLKSANMELKTLNSQLLRTQNELLQAEDRLSSMAETVKDIIWFVTPDKKKILYVNKAYEKIYGKSVQSLYDDPESYLECVHPDDRGNPDIKVNDFSESRMNKKFRVINKKTGATSWVWSQHYLHRDKNGNEYVIGLTSDITAAVQAEERNEINRQLLAQQARFSSLGEMIGAITHQWRQPLNSLYLIVQMLSDDIEDGDLDHEQDMQYISQSMSIIEHMSQTIDDFRDFFKQDKTEELFDAPQTILQILRMLDPQFKAHSINYKISCSCANNNFSCINQYTPEKMIPCKNHIKGKINEFKHVILNLLQNSKEALTSSGRKEKSMNITMTSDNGMFIITVTDNAGGIKPDMLNSIFDAYVTDKENGTGMGLYIAKKVIENKMGGSIKAENENGGAKFTITLPVASETPQP